MRRKTKRVNWELTVKDFDPDAGVEYRRPQQIPYRRSHDIEGLQERLSYAREVLPKLEDLFEKRVASPEFLLIWGSFDNACGFLHAYYFALDDLGGGAKEGGDQVVG